MNFYAIRYIPTGRFILQSGSSFIRDPGKNASHAPRLYLSKSGAKRALEMLRDSDHMRDLRAEDFEFVEMLLMEADDI